MSWEDIPRRLLTICLGVPILWAVWWHPWGRWIFFQGLHIVLCLEYTLLSSSSSAPSSSSPVDAAPKQTASLPWSLQSHPKALLWVPISVVLINVSESTLFHLLVLLVVAFDNIIGASKLHTAKESSTTVKEKEDERQDETKRLRGKLTTSEHVAASGWLFLITLPCRYLLIVSRDFTDIVFLLLTVWNCDTGALVIGRLWKSSFLVSLMRRQAVPNNNHLQQQQQQQHQQQDNSLPTQLLWLRQVSPSKSVAGFIGGWLSGILTFCCLPRLFHFLNHLHLIPTPQTDLATSSWLLSSATSSNTSSTSTLTLLLCGSLLSAAAILGDLWESAIKRQFGVKDTGKILPGHGGILDRFDSSLIAVLLWQLFRERGIL